jgi:hypothetical protein
VRTVIFDEADTMFGTKAQAERNEDLRGLLNAGYERGSPVGRTVGPLHEPKDFHVFAMVALAGIRSMPETIEDRAVVVRMKRRLAGEEVEDFSADETGAQLAPLRERLAAWSAQIMDGVRGYVPAEMGVRDRARDLWKPLTAVADHAGGEWPKLARAAAVALTKESEDDETDSEDLRLLPDIRDVIALLPGVELVKSDMLCQKLKEIIESPWGQYDLNPSKLGQRLRHYQIKTRHNTAGTERGYRREDLEDAIARNLPAKA